MSLEGSSHLPPPTTLQCHTTIPTREQDLQQGSTALPVTNMLPGKNLKVFLPLARSLAPSPVLRRAEELHPGVGVAAV